MDPFSEFDEFFGDLDVFSDSFIERLQKRMSKIEEAIKSGKLKGDWEVKRIDEPGKKGYIIRGRFWTDEPFRLLEPFDPFEHLRPRRRPTPERPFKVPSDASKEIRDPLTDIFEEANAVRVYVELPGEEEKDIKLDFKDGKVEVTAKRFHKMIELPTDNVDKETVTSKYRNGVLELTIPKKKDSEPRYYKL